MLNKIILMGRLTRDPELRKTQSGTKVASFALAVDRDFAGQDGKPVVADGSVADDKFLSGVNFYIKGVEGNVPGGDKK